MLQETDDKTGETGTQRRKDKEGERAGARGEKGERSERKAGSSGHLEGKLGGWLAASRMVTSGERRQR